MSDATSAAAIAAPRHLALSLLLIRLSVAVFLLVWVAHKFLNPERYQGMFEKFYGVATGDAMVLAFGIAQLLIVLAFAIGALKTLSYGAVLLMHGATSIVSYPQYLAPFEGSNILFYAGIPVLAAILALFLLREEDRLLSVG